jgi:hypothetical protein
LSCFCKFCSNNGDGPSDNETYVAPFNFVWLEPCNANDAHANVDFVFHLKSNREALTTILEVGDHFVVIVEEGNMEGCDFWILICEEPLHEVEEEMKKDNWVRWCIKENKLSSEGTINNKARALCHTYCLMEGLL